MKPCCRSLVTLLHIIRNPVLGSSYVAAADDTATHQAPCVRMDPCYRGRRHCSILGTLC
jgi:hypothetical protein